MSPSYYQKNPKYLSFIRGIVPRVVSGMPKAHQEKNSVYPSGLSLCCVDLTQTQSYA